MTTQTAPQWLDPKDASTARLGYLERLAAAFTAIPRPLAEKLDSFPKYVPATAIARFLGRYELYRLVADVPGAIVEAGVLGGSGLLSFAQLAFLLEPHNPYRRIVGFDTFEGFPSIAEADAKGTSPYLKEGGFADDSFEEISQLAAIHEDFRFLKSRRQIELVRGDICKTVPDYAKAHGELAVALLYLDCDLYEPTKVCLETLLPLMPKGAVVAFDELTLAEYPGETAALRDALGVGKLRLKKLPFLKMSYAVIE